MFDQSVTQQTTMESFVLDDAVNSTTLPPGFEIMSFEDFVRGNCIIRLIYMNHVITFSVFTFFGLIGNFALLTAILRTASLRNAPNILLINITVADFLFIIVSTPFNILHELNPCWLYGSIACKLRHYLPLVSQAVGILSLAALSRERYNAIVRGLQSRISRSTRRTLFVLAFTWITGFIIASPVFYLSKTPLGIQCQFMPMNNIKSQVFMISKFMFLYIIPLVYISANYIRLARSLCNSTMVDLAQNQSAANTMLARKRLAQIVMVITALFGILWFPYYAYWLWFVFNTKTLNVYYDINKIRYFRHLYYYMSLSNSCINSWIVFFMSSAHRQSFLQCFKCLNRSKNKRKMMVVRNRQMSSRASSSSYTCHTVVSKI